MNTIKLSTPCGDILGIDTADCYEFRGIRYAVAGRWEYPAFVTDFGTLYDATEFGACSYQRRGFEKDEDCNPFYHKEFRQGMTFNYSEDCLFLNIYAPKNAHNAPVLFYIHGGSFTGGSANEGHINGTEYAKRGIVFVSVNYRLNAFGFCSHPDLTDKKGRCGNFGLYDQVAALNWVKNNILAFGGDGNRITVMGQSAGAMSIDILISSPICKGLIKGAIMMSGGALQREVARPLTPEKTRKFWDEIIKNAGLSSIFELKKVSEKKLFYAWLDACRSHKVGSMLYTLPVYDGVLLKKSTFGKKNMPHMPYILGVTQTDMVPVLLEGITKKFAKNIIKSGSPCYIYNFNHDLPGDNSGAWHSCDLLYAFGTLKNNWRPFEKLDFDLSYQMIESFASFVKTGSPKCEAVPFWNSSYDMPVRFCENTRSEKWDTKKLLKNTFSKNGAEF